MKPMKEGGRENNHTGVIGGNKINQKEKTANQKGNKAPFLMYYFSPFFFICLFLFVGFTAELWWWSGCWGSKVATATNSERVKKETAVILAERRRNPDVLVSDRVKRGKKQVFIWPLAAAAKSRQEVEDREKTSENSINGVLRTVLSTLAVGLEL